MTYEFDGKKYEKASAHQKEWGIKLINELGLQGGESVLDLGCGEGTLTAQIADRVPGGEVIGIDASRGMIDAARPKAQRNLKFILMDINDIDFVGQFDVIFSNAALHWLKDHQSLLRKASRALRVGGRLRFNFAGNGNCSHFFRVIREAMSLEDFRDYFTKFAWPWYMPSVDEYFALMKAVGLDDARVWGENADRFFQNAEMMTNWIDQPSLVPFLVHIPDSRKNAFREYVVRRMIEETQQDDGRCFETFRRINAYAGK